jgi:hypothetical protein
MTWAKTAAIIVVVVIVGLFVRYGTLRPCEWIYEDMASISGVPKFLVNAMLVGQLTSNPSQFRCLRGWVKLHTEGLSEFRDPSRHSSASIDDGSLMAGGTSPALIRSIQHRLLKLGYDPGPVDGQFGDRTRAAIARFQYFNGDKEDGRPTVKVLESLDFEIVIREAEGGK